MRMQPRRAARSPGRSKPSQSDQPDSRKRHGVARIPNGQSRLMGWVACPGVRVAQQGSGVDNEDAFCIRSVLG